MCTYNLINKKLIFFAQLLPSKMGGFNLTTIIALALLVGIIIFIGRELEVHYPDYTDYVEKGGKSTIVQQLRAGAFILLDYGSDLIYPGSREKMLLYKRNKGIKATPH